MVKYPINKGIGRSPEFKGLKSQYLFIFAGGLLALFVEFVIMYMAGIDQWICIGFGVISASVLVLSLIHIWLIHTPDIRRRIYPMVSVTVYMAASAIGLNGRSSTVSYTHLLVPILPVRPI